MPPQTMPGSRQPGHLGGRFAPNDVSVGTRLRKICWPAFPRTSPLSYRITYSLSADVCSVVRCELVTDTEFTVASTFYPFVVVGWLFVWTEHT